MFHATLFIITGQLLAKFRGTGAFEHRMETAALRAKCVSAGECSVDNLTTARTASADFWSFSSLLRACVPSGIGGWSDLAWSS